MALVVDCPTQGNILLGYGAIRALVNLEPGVVVVWWDCPCGHDHIVATGHLAERDPERAARAVRAVRAAHEAGGASS